MSAREREGAARVPGVPRRGDRRRAGRAVRLPPRRPRRRSRCRRSRRRTASTRPSPQRVLGLPEPRVLDRIKAAWREDRKPANMLLVVDTSGSMNDESRLARAKEGLETFFREVSPQRPRGPDDLLRPDPARSCRSARSPPTAARLDSTVGNLIADGGTAFFDATVEGLRRGARAGRPTSASTRWCCSPTARTPTPPQRSRRWWSCSRAQGDSSSRVRVFTIAYSAGARGPRRRSTRIAQASGGQAYKGDTEDIETVYRSISSFF